MKDLVALVPDQDYEKVLDGLLARHQALGIKPLTFQYYRHPNRDAGCRAKCTSFLRPFINQFEHALVMFDLEGSGVESQSQQFCVNQRRSAFVAYQAQNRGRRWFVFRLIACLLLIVERAL
jgi:hypothetical protein